MYIKGFDKDLKCRGFQFEIGKEYKIDTDKELKLCSDTVFHFCDNLQNVHQFYDCSNADNRFCEIEVIGEIIKDDVKMGSNHIKVVREILGEELNVLKCLINGNTGLFNTGNKNTGYSNTGNSNTGDSNTGDWNTGNKNTGDWNTGYRNTGDRNTGSWNTGDRNTGYWNTGSWNTGDRNTGSWNTGDRNTGSWNTGSWNTCDYSSGFFCTKEPMAVIFDIETNMTVSEFRNSKYMDALYSSPFKLTEWIYYTQKERLISTENDLIGGYLKRYTYQEACDNWWKNMTQENKLIIKSIPNFNAKIFKQITGIEV